MAECKKSIGLYAIKRDPRNPNYWWEETLIKAFNTEEAAEKFKVMVTTGSPRITKYDKILEKYPELVVMPINHTIKC